MPLKSQQNLVQPVATPEQIASGTPRSLRAQAVHRLQIGLFGLAAMLLLVGLANIIMDRARLAEAAGDTPEATSTKSAKTSSDPLADIGALPASDPSAAAKAK